MTISRECKRERERERERERKREREREKERESKLQNKAKIIIRAINIDTEKNLKRKNEKRRLNI